MQRLQKVLAAIGLGSRRQIEEWIIEGRIVIEGQVATLGTKIHGDEKIQLDGKSLQLYANKPLKRRVLRYFKPIGEVTTRHDPEGRSTIFERLPKVTGRWVNIGRLDINTQGLLLLTNDGELAHRLMHPSHQIEREYAVRILGSVPPHILEELKTGVMLDDGLAKFDHIEDAGGEGANHWYHVTLSEGKNREVRRLWEAKGFTVSRLIRIRYGNVTLPRHLRAGQFEDLEGDELMTLLQLVGIDAMSEVRPAGSDEPSGRPTHKKTADRTASRRIDSRPATRRFDERGARSRDEFVPKASKPRQKYAVKAGKLDLDSKETLPELQADSRFVRNDDRRHHRRDEGRSESPRYGERRTEGRNTERRSFSDAPRQQRDFGQRDAERGESRRPARDNDRRSHRQDEGRSESPRYGERRTEGRSTERRSFSDAPRQQREFGQRDAGRGDSRRPARDNDRRNHKQDEGRSESPRYGERRTEGRSTERRSFSDAPRQQRAFGQRDTERGEGHRPVRDNDRRNHRQDEGRSGSPRYDERRTEGRSTERRSFSDAPRQQRAFGQRDTERGEGRSARTDDRRTGTRRTESRGRQFSKTDGKKRSTSRPEKKGF